MAKYVNGKLVKGPVKKNIIINVYAKDGLHSVTTGGFLGTIDMHPVGSSPDFAGTGSFGGKTYPVEVVVTSLGSVPVQKEYVGDKLVEQDKIVNALDYVDFDRIEKLTDEEKATLSAISTKAIHSIVVNALEASPRVWTPFIDACQDADQKLELPQVVEVPDYVEIEGRKAIGCSVIADINGARFLFGEGGFVRCSDGRDLYQFWTAAAVGIFPDGDVYYPND